MVLVSLIYPQIVNFRKFFFRFLLLSFCFFVNSVVYAQCDSSDLAYQSGLKHFERGQFLLSAQEFLVAQKFNCPQNLSKSSWGHLLAITELGEKDEMFYLAFQELPQRLSKDDQNKLSIYQNFYFPEVYAKSSAYKPIQDKIKIFNHWQDNLPQAKSEYLAGTLSAVLPGAGQAYTGAWQSAAMAFLLNALFLSATVELQDQGLYATSLASGVIFSITYIGNIFNAAKSAEVINEQAQKSLIESEKRQKFPELYF